MDIIKRHVAGWTLTRYQGSGDVEGEADDGFASFTLDAEDLAVDVGEKEWGHGFEGDSASIRYIPAQVLVAAIEFHAQKDS